MQVCKHHRHNMPSLEVFSQVSNLHSQAFDAFKANEACQGSSPSFDVPHREGSNCVGASHDVSPKISDSSHTPSFELCATYSYSPHETDRN